jgi:hypothetical protein
MGWPEAIAEAAKYLSIGAGVIGFFWMLTKVN